MSLLQLHLNVFTKNSTIEIGEQLIIGKIFNYNSTLIFELIMESRRQNTTKPIQLICFDGDKNLVLSQQAVKLFESLQAQQLHVVTVAGKYRTGKSYILNRVLLNQSNGFQVGPTINACTKGLWMWPKLVQIEIGQQKKKCVIIDTEGLGSLQQGQNTDIKIFIMAILLSSYLIYNSVGNIDQKALENLSLVVNLAEMLQKNNNQYDSQQLINSFPSFMWLVRDFSLRLQNQSGEPMTSQQYLQNALKSQNGTTQVLLRNKQAVQKKNNIRKKLKQFFHDRNCFTLVRPTENEKDLQNLSILPQKKLRPQFLRLINEFKQTVACGIKVKRVRGKNITPQGFIQLCKYFVSTINSGKLPSINSHWDNLCIKQSSRIIEKFGAQHAKRLGESYNQDDQIEEKLQKMEILHCSITKQAFGQIDKSFLGRLQKQLSKQRLVKLLTKIYEAEVKQINQKRYMLVKNKIKDIFEKIVDEFQSNQIKSFQQIFSRFQQIKQEYKHDNRIYQSFYQNSKDVFQQFLKNLRNQWQRQQMVLCEKNGYLSSQIQQTTKQMKQKYNEMKEAMRQLEGSSYKNQLQNCQLRKSNEQLKHELSTLNEEYDRLVWEVQQLNMQRQKVDNQNTQQIKQQFHLQIDRLKDLNTKTEIELAKLKQLYKEVIIKQRKTQRQTQIFKTKCSEYLKQNIELTQAVQKLNRKLLQFQQTQRQAIMKKIKCPQELSDAMQNINAHINQLEIKLKLKQQENRNLQSVVNNQNLANEALLRAPQNLNYNVLKKNYEMEIQSNLILQNRIKDVQLILSLSSIRCLICSKVLQKSSAKSHFQNCSQFKQISFDVSYQYNANSEIQFVIDVCLSELNWTIRKTMANIRYLLKKLHINSNLFLGSDSGQQDINLNEERRLFLDDLFNENKLQIWSNTFLIEYFGIDIQFLNRSQDKNKRSIPARTSKVSVDLENLMAGDSDQHLNDPTSNLLMKTTKFSRKTFNFGNI